MKKRYTSFWMTLTAAAMMSLTSCDLIEPGDTVNPNVTDSDFLNAPNAMHTWVNGTEKNFAVAMGTYCQLLEIASDNYYNNYTRSNRDFDRHVFMPSDEDVQVLQRYVGNLRESVDYGLKTVIKHDPNITPAEHFRLAVIKTFSHILAGETFTGLPDENGGKVIAWQEHLNRGLACADSALYWANADSARALAHTLKARLYYRLGEATQAVEEARQALTQAPEMLEQVQFDGANNVNNVAQEAIWGNWFQPLPRLDFLDPKYFQTKSTEQRPVTIAKAEENYLIIAEAQASAGQIDDAKSTLRQLLTLVKSRPVAHGIDDHLEGRYNGGSKHYPDGSLYRVAASPADSLRSNLVLDRQQPHLIDIPYISGTSVTPPMIESCGTEDAALELIYLLRQEIFFGEGRRMADLGMRMPVCDIEAAHTASAKGYDTAVIPSFIPAGSGLDDFTMDESKHEVVITYNMNRVIVENKHSQYVVPFVK